MKGWSHHIYLLVIFINPYTVEAISNSYMVIRHRSANECCGSSDPKKYGEYRKSILRNILGTCYTVYCHAAGTAHSLSITIYKVRQRFQ